LRSSRGTANNNEAEPIASEVTTLWRYTNMFILLLSTTHLRAHDSIPRQRAAEVELRQAKRCLEAASRHGSCRLKLRITYKLCLLMHVPHSHWTGRAIFDRSNSFCIRQIEVDWYDSGYILPRTRIKYEECDFCYSGPAVWNSLPSDLHDVTDINTFKKWR